MSERTGLYERLREYARTDYYPMHMPGHKRNSELCGDILPYSMDITEIDGFDNLHLPEGILKEAMERAANVFGAEQTYFLVNGSTCGLLAGISACTNPGDRILMARNCHKAVYHAVYIRQLRPVYLCPEEVPEFGICGGIDPEQVREALRRYPDVKLIVITSPTYEGVISEVEAIAQIAHEAGAVLLVDEAHGAHLGFGHGFPESAIRLGADIVVQSVHKTLPSPTQTALLHVCRRKAKSPEQECGDGIGMSFEERKARVKRFLGIYQSSSPSYLLMAGIDRCVELIKERGDELFAAWRERLLWFSSQTRGLRRIRILKEEEMRRGDGFDPSKLVLSVRGTGKSGAWLYERLLFDYHIQPEMASGDYVICMTGLGDTSAGMERLAAALQELDSVLEHTEDTPDKPPYDPNADMAHRSCARILVPEQYSWEMPEPGTETERLALPDCAERVSVEYIYLYPPGIPLVVPGERLTKELLLELSEYKRGGLALRGMEDESGEYLNVRRQ